MKINVYGQRLNDEHFELVKVGDTLIVNGEPFDFSPLPDGASIPGTAISSKWFALKDVSRVDGELIINLIYPIPANFSPEQATPAYLVNVPDGVVELPKPLPEPEQIQQATASPFEGQA